MIGTDYPDGLSKLSKVMEIEILSEDPYKGVITIMGYQLIKVSGYEADISPVRSLNIE